MQGRDVQIDLQLEKLRLFGFAQTFLSDKR